jgi:transglutaminase-like putative cysteine protease
MVAGAHASSGAGAGAAVDRFLTASTVFDFEHPAVRRLARRLGSGGGDAAELAGRIFVWVRDQIRHTADVGDGPLTCTASEVLAHRTGLCFAKSHLFVALCRENGIAAGLCYQRLADGKGGGALHGLAAVLLPGHGWYRCDPRGRKPGLDARFCPPREQLAFEPAGGGAWDGRLVHPEPLPLVLDALRSGATLAALAGRYPDLATEPARSRA